MGSPSRNISLETDSFHDVRLFGSDRDGHSLSYSDKNSESGLSHSKKLKLSSDEKHSHSTSENQQGSSSNKYSYKEISSSKCNDLSSSQKRNSYHKQNEKASSSSKADKERAFLENEVHKSSRERHKDTPDKSKESSCSNRHKERQKLEQVSSNDQDDSSFKNDKERPSSESQKSSHEKHKEPSDKSKDSYADRHRERQKLEKMSSNKKDDYSSKSNTKRPVSESHKKDKSSYEKHGERSNKNKDKQPSSDSQKVSSNVQKDSPSRNNDERTAHEHHQHSCEKVEKTFHNNKDSHSNRQKENDRQKVSSDKHKDSSTRKERERIYELHKSSPERHKSKDSSKKSIELSGHKNSSRHKESFSDNQNVPSNKEKDSSPSHVGEINENKPDASSSSGKDFSSTEHKHNHTPLDGHKKSSNKQNDSSPKRHGSSHFKSSSDKHRDSSAKKEHAPNSSHGAPKSPRSFNKRLSYEIDNTLVSVSSDCGYVTSPDISSESESESEEEEEETFSEQALNGSQSIRDAEDDESVAAPVTLKRHHLNPTLDRHGGSSLERNKILAKLDAIRQKMNADADQGANRKRAARGEVKRRRAKREKLEGDFSGSCMEKIEYNLEEKPSLKRPEPKPEEPKPEKPLKKEKPKKIKIEKPRKKEKEKKSEKRVKEKIERERTDKKPSKTVKEKYMKSESQSQSSRFDALREKPKFKPRPRAQPPPFSFAELMKIAEEKQVKPVSIDFKVPKKEKPQRPMTQEEIDMKQAREARIQTKEYKDWYKYGSQGKPTNENDGNSSSAKSDTSPFPQSSYSKSQPHPTRPGMIANKPSAMAQHASNESRHNADCRPDTSHSARSDAEKKIRNVWDSLFSRPDYKKQQEQPASRNKRPVIDSGDADYDSMDDFIDDEGEEDMGNVSTTIQKMFGYDKRKYRDEDDDDRSMEVGFSQIMKEEARSARIGREEDLEDIRREEEELKRKRLQKMKR